MHARHRELMILGCLCLALGAAAPAEEPAPDADETTLDAAITHVYQGQHVQAARILTAIIAEERTNPDYYVVHALSRIIAGGGRERTAATALETSRQYRPDSPETHALLALCYRRLGNNDEARKYMQLLERHRAEEPVWHLVQAMDKLLQGQWAAANEQFDLLARSKSEYAGEAARRAATLQAFLAEYNQQAEALQARQSDLDKETTRLKAQLAENAADLESVQRERETLRAAYDVQKDRIDAAFQNRVALIERIFDDEEDDAEDDEDDDALRQAKRKRDRLLLQAQAQRKDDYEQLDQAFKPRVDKNTTQLKQAQRNLANTRKDRATLDATRQKLLREQRALDDLRPFDVEPLWQDMALWIARVPLSRSDLPGPKPAQTDRADSEAPAWPPVGEGKVESVLRRPTASPPAP